MNYSKVFSESWRVFRSFRALWLLGLLTGCSGLPLFPNFQAIEEGGFGLSLFMDPSFFEDFFNVGNSPELFFSFFFQLMLYMLILGLIVFVVRIIGRTATIKAVQYEHETNEKLGLVKVIQLSIPHLPKVFLFTILFGIAFLFTYFGIYIFSYIASIFTFGLGFMILFPVILVLSLFASVFYEMGLRALLLEDVGIFQAFNRGWDLIRGQLLNSGIFGTVFYFLQTIVLQIIFVPLYIFMLPIFFRIGPFPLTGPSQPDFFDTFTHISSIAILIYYPVIWITTGLLQTVTQTAWNKVYREYMSMETP